MEAQVTGNPLQEEPLHLRKKQQGPQLPGELRRISQQPQANAALWSGVVLAGPNPGQHLPRPDDTRKL